LDALRNRGAAVMRAKMPGKYALLAPAVLTAMVRNLRGFSLFRASV
jgi:hypothetical protein